MLTNSPATQTKWSVEEIEILKELRSLGHSASAISDKIKRTRNSILGKAHRLKLAAPSKVPTPNPKKPKRKPSLTSAPRLTPRRRRPKVATVSEPPPIAPDPVPVCAPVALLDRRSNQCPAVLDEPRAPDGLAMVCAAPRARGSSWCAAHHIRFVTMMSSQR